RQPPQILDAAQLGGRVARQGQARAVRRHAVAVVDDADQLAAAARDLDRDGVGPGVEGVLDQLLDHRGRPLDHLARRDLIDDRLRQDLDARQDVHAAVVSRRCDTLPTIAVSIRFAPWRATSVHETAAWWRSPARA